MKSVIYKQTDNSIINIIVFCMGMFSTMPIVALKLMGHYFSLFTIFFGLSFIYLLFSASFKRFNIKACKNTLLVIIWFVMSLISSLFGWLYFVNAPEWRSTSLYYVARVCLYIVFAFLWGTQNTNTNLSSYVIKGLLIGCILNMVWAVIDAVGFYIFSVSVNNVVFRQYAIDHNTRYGTVSLIINGMIRAGGFNDDPAHIGFIAPAMVAYSIYKKKGWIFLLSLAAIISSTSTTALVCTFVVVVLNINRITKMVNSRNVIRCTIVIVLILFVLIIIPNAFSMIFSVAQKFFNRIFSTYSGLESGGERSVYILEFFKAVSVAGIMCFFGTGFGTASYAYVFDKDILQQLGTVYNFPYDMEMTYISYFFDLGIFGLIVYLLILYKILKGTKRIENDTNSIMRALLVGMILSAMFYHYTIMAMQVLVIIIGMGNLDKNAQMQSIKKKAATHKQLIVA